MNDPIVIFYMLNGRLPNNEECLALITITAVAFVLTIGALYAISRVSRAAPRPKLPPDNKSS